MQIFDSHVHFFNPKIIDNVSGRKELVGRLKLRTENALERLEVDALSRSFAASRVAGGLALPTAVPADVVKTNDRFLEIRSGNDALHVAGTLHPEYAGNEEEIERLCRRGVRAVKLCSFSQGFSPAGGKALALFEALQRHNESCAHRFFVVLDTLYRADRWFGTDPAFNTTPAAITFLAQRFPAVIFVGAHMGGLSAPFELLRRDLNPLSNLYLDTSNAAYTLSKGEFVHLLKKFGPGRVLFGTDWPWFIHEEEIGLIGELTEQAGFSAADKQAVFYGNIAGLLGL